MRQYALAISTARMFVVLCAFSCFLWLSSSEAFAQSEARADPDPARFESEIAAFDNWDRQNSFPQGAILFVGSSSIRMWQTAESFPGWPVINRGFGGSHISDVNHFADRIVFKYKPRAIVFYAGDNDIADGKSPQQVARDFESFVHLVHSQLPDTRIIYLPIKPSLARWKHWPDMQQANGHVEELAKRDEDLDYVDTATPMLDSSGKPRVDLFLDDGLHLNAKGYRFWNEILSPHLERLAASQLQ
jgi:lysophospholipase L1-like esterase